MDCRKPLTFRAIKDLRVIQNRSLETVFLIDNCVSSFGNQIANGIPIQPFEGDSNDRELLLLRDYLLKLYDLPEKHASGANLTHFGLDTIRFSGTCSQYIEKLRLARNRAAVMQSKDDLKMSAS